MIVEDAYSIPRIQDTLNCLQDAVWLTLLDIKRGYWHVELEEASKALTAFVLGPLRFCEMRMNTIWADECSSNIPAPHGDLFG